MITQYERARFDALLEEVLATIPPRLHELLDESPLIVEDRPSRTLLEQLGMDPAQETLCGLHSGAALTERSVLDEDQMPETIHLFRGGIIMEAGGWSATRDERGRPIGGDEAVREQIRVTLLHEIGHHFGLEEEDLEELGYG